MLGNAFDMVFTMLVTIFAFVSVPLYPVAQIGVVLMRRGVGMWLALLPVLPMIAAYVVFHQAWQEGANLSPLVLIFTSPIALIWILIVGSFARRRDLVGSIDRLLSRGWD